MVTPGQGKERLEALISSGSFDYSDRNEATTCFQVLDQIIDTVLGWPRDRVTREDHDASAGRRDYTLRSDFRSVVIEAKREGKHFDIPAGVTGPFALVKDIMVDPSAKEVIEQVTRYASSAGIAYAVAWNGTQLCAFMGSRADNVRVYDGRCLLLSSPEEMVEHFDDLWNTLSYEAVTRDMPAQLFASPRRLASGLKLSRTIGNYPRIDRHRSNGDTGTTVLADILVDVLDRAEQLQDDFIEHCYCEPGALPRMFAQARHLWESRYAGLDESLKSSSTRAPSPTDPSGDDPLSSFPSASRPVVLLGDVGVGKTTFKRALQTRLRNEVADRCWTFDLDLARLTEVDDNLARNVGAALEVELRERYQTNIRSSEWLEDIFRRDLAAFDEGPWKDAPSDQYRVERIKFLTGLAENQEGLLKKSLERIRTSHHRDIVIFLDNIDQKSVELQEQALSLADAMAQGWSALVFVAIRPETFYASQQRRGVASSMSPHVLTIHPPRINEALRLRLEYCARHMRNGDFLGALPSGVSLDASWPTVLDRFRASLDDPGRDKPSRLASHLNGLSGGNMREALDLVRAFLMSYDGEKFCSRAKENRRTTVDDRAFLRGAIFRDRTDYSPSVSGIPNAFDVSSEDRREHFLLPWLASLALRRHQDVDSAVDLQELRQAAGDAGYSPEQFEFAILRGLHGGLWAPRPPMRVPEKGLPESLTGIVPLPRSQFLVERLLQEFVYYDAVSVDTPVLDAEVRASLKPSIDLSDRIDRADAFIQYLDACAASTPIANEIGWKGASEAALKAVERVRSSHEKNVRERPLFRRRGHSGRR